MAVCKSCSAPLAANTNICQYCGVRNDVDLQNKQDYTVVVQESERLCPHCRIPLQIIDLKVKGDFYIERCQTCFGLFFVPGEIEALLDSSVSEGTNINWQLLDNINQERYPIDHKVKYLKCPVCQVLMNRVNFGYRSGVVVNRCMKHGVWLDSGEITHLLEWKKAGGQLWDQQQQQEKAQIKIHPQNLERDFSFQHSDPQVAFDDEPDLLKTLSNVVFKLFS
jgi:Zn-finger nucleic acid-binding protein